MWWSGAASMWPCLEESRLCYSSCVQPPQKGLEPHFSTCKVQAGYCSHSLPWLQNYLSWSFVTIFTAACYWPLSWASWIHSIPLHPVSLRSIVIPFCLCLGLSSGVFLFRFSGRLLYVFLFTPMLCTPCQPQPPWFYHHNSIWWRIQIMNFKHT